MDLIHMSQENETMIRNAAINRTKNFVNKVQDRYSIWRVLYQNPMSDSVLMLMKDQIIMAKVYASIFYSKKEFDLCQLLIMRIKENQDAIGDASSDNELHERYVSDDCEDFILNLLSCQHCNLRFSG